MDSGEAVVVGGTVVVAAIVVAVVSKVLSIVVGADSDALGLSDVEVADEPEHADTINRAAANVACGPRRIAERLTHRCTFKRPA